jgi:transcriptional regulator GlxA family with amidase domain
MDDRLKRIGMLLFEDCDLLDFAGPTAAFHSAARHLIRAAQTSELLYSVEPLSMDGGPVRTLQGIVVETKPAPSLSAGLYDTLIVTGGFCDHRSCDPRLIAWIRNNHQAARRVASVCCGAFMLGAAGLLDGRRATTHWEDCDHLQESFPEVDVQPDSIYVKEGRVWTAAGIASGIDMALAMIEEDHGHRIALMVARNLVVFLKRPGGQSQFSALLQSQSAEGPISALLDWIVAHPRGDLRAEALAERVNMSLRNFYRAFESATGMSPAGWVEMARIETAKRLLEQRLEHVDQVAYMSGFGSYDAMRKSFARRLGVTPREYRERFAPDCEGGRQLGYRNFVHAVGAGAVDAKSIQ